MGIAPYIAEAIIREHKFRPIKGDVLLLGRQTIMLTPEWAVAMVRGHGLEPAASAADIDNSTLAGAGRGYITDAAFFRLLGVKAIRAMDVSAYEGAEIIHDLNTPVPAELENSADFILDGSTLDNLFNPAVALQSVTRMLRPGGRFLATNLASAHFSPYTILTPYWFADYFAANRFADAKVYATTHGSKGELEVLAVRPGQKVDQALRAQELTGIVVFAEKGETTTWATWPCQRRYADEGTISRYRDVEMSFAAAGRPELLVSIRPRPRGFSIFRSFLEHHRAARVASTFQQVAEDGRRVDLRPTLTQKLEAMFRRPAV